MREPAPAQVNPTLLEAGEAAWRQRIEAPVEARVAAHQVLERALAGGAVVAAGRARLTLLLLALRCGEGPPEPGTELAAIETQLDSVGDASGLRRARILRALLLGEAGERDAAIDLLASGKQAALAESPPGDALLQLNLLGNYLLEAGQLAAALSVWYEALERARAQDEPPETAMVELNLAVLHLRHCDFGAAALLLSTAWARMNARGDRAYRLVCAGNLAAVWLLQGRAAEARKLLLSLLKDARESFDAFDRQFFEIMLAQAELRCGLLAEAQARLDACAARRTADGLDSQLDAPLALARSERLLLEGRLDEAQASLDSLDTNPAADAAADYERRGLLFRLHEARGELRLAWQTARTRQDGLVHALRRLQAAEQTGRQARYEAFRSELEQHLLRESRQRGAEGLARVEAAQGELGRHRVALEGLRLRLKELALRDPLTGLYNRRLLAELLPREIATARRAARPLSLALLDLEASHAVGEQRRSGAGDRLRRELAAMIRRLAPLPAMGLRYAENAFCVVLPGLEGQAAARLLERIQQEFRAISGGEVPAFSAGIAQLAAHDESTTLLARAGSAQNHARLHGVPRIVVATPA